MAPPNTPLLTTDIIIELSDRPDWPIVLIQRHNPPTGWALPGGFVDRGERVEAAAVREAAEETGLRVILKTLLGVYSSPDRDPRGHTVSVCYVAEAQGEPQADSDASDLAVFAVNAVPEALAFDHGQILADYKGWRINGEPAPLRLS